MCLHTDTLHVVLQEIQFWNAEKMYNKINRINGTINNV